MDTNYDHIPNDTEADRDRLNRRLASIRGTDLARELKHFRNLITRKGNLQAGDAPRYTVPGTKRQYWRRLNEVNICHAWLDERNVPSMLTMRYRA
jgi:transcriptional regulator of NAD metabolism